MRRSPLILAFVLAALVLGSAAYAEQASAPVAYADGVYALDYKDAELGSVSVSVKVAGGKIESVTLPSGKGDVAMEDAPLADWLKAFVAAPDLMAVDAVSGATTSCDLIKNAVQAALKQAIKK